MKTTAFLKDCESLAATALRKKYRVEANSHRAMLGRRKTGSLVAPEFLDFRSFLRHVGRCPEKGYTLDRLENTNPEYAPGKVAWRSKTDQSRNRRNVIHLTDSNGTTRTLSEWAEITKQSRYTLHSRKKRGWSDHEVIWDRSEPAAQAVYQGFPWPKGREAQWEAGYRREAWTLPIGRRELRAEFLLRICRAQLQELMESVERAVPPGTEAGPEHGELFKRVEGWRRESRRAAALLARPGYREP